MSEITPTTPDTPTAEADAISDTGTDVGTYDAAQDRTPSETIAAAALERLEAAEAQDTAVEPVIDTAPVVDEDSIEAVQPKDRAGRENRIPYSRVQKIIANQVKKATADFETRLAETTRTSDDLRQRATTSEQHLQQMAAVEQIMQSDPDAFIQMMAQVDPRYSRYIKSAPHSGRSAPEADIHLADGRKTYSEQHVQQIIADLEQRLSERYAPVEQTVGQWQETQRQQALFQQASTQVADVLADARTWPQFKESEADILKVLQSDPKISLEGAYRKVVYPKLSTDRNKVREEVLAEINSRPRSTSVPVTKSGGTQSSGPRTSADIAREALRRLEGN